MERLAREAEAHVEYLKSRAGKECVIIREEIELMRKEHAESMTSLRNDLAGIVARQRDDDTHTHTSSPNRLTGTM